MDKIIETCTRVEGHSSLNFIFKSEELSHTEFTFSLYRGFENILIGKNILDLPKIVSRICGLCFASQAIASCKAIEDIYGIQPSDQSIQLRKLLMTSELIRSHLLHFFFQTFPDLLKIFKISDKINTPYAIFNYNDQITTKVYNLLKISGDISRLVGGRIIHPITTIPGGIINNSKKNNLLLIQKHLKRAKDYSKELIEHFITIFAKFKPPKEYDFSKLSLLGLSNDISCSRYDGKLILKEQESKSKLYEVMNYKELFDKNRELYGIDFKEIDPNQILTGPYARFIINNDYYLKISSEFFSQLDESWKKSILFANLLQLIEIYLEIQQNLEILTDDFIYSKWTLPSLKETKKEDGIGTVEAPRGLLMHHYHINHNLKVDSAKLFIATEFNLPIINDMIAKYAQKIYVKQDLEVVKEKVQMMIRAFDPCISCLSH